MMLRHRGRLVLTTRAQGRALRQPRRVFGYFKVSSPYLTLAALSGYTSLSPSMLRKLMRQAHDPLPSFTVGRRRLFNKAAVDGWMARREAQESAMDSWLKDLRARRRA